MRPPRLGAAGCLLALGALALLGGLAACAGEPQSAGWEYMPDMVDSVAYDTFAPNGINPQGQTLRAPAPGTVPRGFLPFPYGPGPAEAERAGRELVDPFVASPEVLARAETLFHTFCQPCHGATGQGDGPVTKKFPPPPAYTSTGTRDLPAGRIFHIITRGSNRMPSYASQIAPDDRWRLVLWIQKLQHASPPTPPRQTAAHATETRPGASHKVGAADPPETGA